MMLVACRFDDDRLVPSRSAVLDLYWRVLAPMDLDHSVYIQVFDAAGQVIAREDTYPGGGAYATSRLQPGDELHDRYVLAVSPDARPGVGHLDVGLYDFPGLERLPAYDGAHRLMPSPNVAPLRVFVPGPAPAPAPVAASYSFGDGIALEGYELDTSDARPGGAIAGALYWRSHGRPSAPPVAQLDSPPQGGAYPTSLWRPGDAVYHPFRIQLASDVPSGEYTLLVGLYDPETDRRLAIDPGPAGRLAAAARRLVGGVAEPWTEAALAPITVKNAQPSAQAR
jgi:hypothetical protein